MHDFYAKAMQSIILRFCTLHRSIPAWIQVLQSLPLLQGGFLNKHADICTQATGRIEWKVFVAMETNAFIAGDEIFVLEMNVLVPEMNELKTSVCLYLHDLAYDWYCIYR